MKEKLVSVETAKLLKILGFNEPTLFFAYEDNQTLVFASSLVGCYDRDNPENLNFSKNTELLEHHGSLLNGEGIQEWSLPTQALAQKWFRETKDLHIQPNWLEAFNKWDCDIFCFQQSKYISEQVSFETYEEALEAGLKAACEYLKTFLTC